MPPAELVEGLSEATLSELLWGAEGPRSSQGQTYNPGAESDPDSDQDYEDVVEDAKSCCLAYGVQWTNFEPSLEKALFMALYLSGKNEVTDYYIGVAKAPALRFYEPPSPHCSNFKAM